MIKMSLSVNRSTFDKVMVPNYGPADFIPVKGKGSRVWDQEGREYVDFAGGIAVNALGHCHPELVAALTAQAQTLWHVSNAFTNEPALKLATLLTENTFAERVFFCNSGAEANEAAFKLARKYAADHMGPHKHKILSCYGSFHGRTLFTVTVGGQAKYTEGFAPLPAGISHFEFNNCDSLKAAISDETCAVVIEPIQGEGGVLPATPDFLIEARRLCDKHNALLIFDEVQTGVGRTGSLYAYMGYDVIPDIVSSAKGLGGGVPIGAILTTEKIANSFGVGTHGSTFGGNPLACAVACKLLDIVKEPSVLAGVYERQQWLQDGLCSLKNYYNVFEEVRGRGLLLGCVMSNKYLGKARAFLNIAAKHGLMVLVAGPNVVRLAPSLLIERGDIEEGLSRFELALTEMHNL